jgi:hypothetical protein
MYILIDFNSNIFAVDKIEDCFAYSIDYHYQREFAKNNQYEQTKLDMTISYVF